MAFETIERVGTPAANAVPRDGVKLATRKAPRGGRFIALTIGVELARALCLKGDVVRLAIALGNGRDAGCLGLSVDVQGGGHSLRGGRRPATGR